MAGPRPGHDDGVSLPCANAAHAGAFAPAFLCARVLRVPVHAPRPAPDTAEALRAPAPPPPRPTDHVPLAILYMLGATVLFAGSSAVSKWQIETYSFVEIVFLRTLASLATCFVLIVPRTGL